MLVEPPARGIRIGGVTVAAGESRAVAIGLTSAASRPAEKPEKPGKAQKQGKPGKDDKGPGRDVPAWVAVGNRAGPRVCVVAGIGGFETAAVQAASALVGSVEAANITGGLVVVPVLRAGGQLAPGGRPRSGWSFPGDAAGSRSARDAFTLFSDLVIGTNVLVVLGAPRPGRAGAVVVRGDLNDPRTRRIALQSGAMAALSATPPPASLLAAAVGSGVVVLELRAAGLPGDEAAPVQALVMAVRAILTGVGVLPGTAGENSVRVRPAARNRAPAPPVLEGALVLRAAQGGLVDARVAAGQFARKGAVLAHVRPTVGGKPSKVVASRDGLILESTLSAVTRRGSKLFVLAPLSLAAARRRELTVARVRAAGAKVDLARLPVAKLHVGWVENVQLPNLGIRRLKAKIDTGARSSALHVARMRTVDTAGGPGRRPILELTVPSGRRGGKSLKVRAAVRGYVAVRDTSGRLERRPVIETALQLGPITKRIAVTLTNRGEMLFPMLIGRTALGPGIVVDPSRRYLISS